jgi:hypothetical protein
VSSLTGGPVNGDYVNSVTRWLGPDRVEAELVTTHSIQRDTDRRTTPNDDTNATPRRPHDQSRWTCWCPVVCLRVDEIGQIAPGSHGVGMIVAQEELSFG